MCTAMKEIIEESRQEGRVEGLVEGLVEGRRDSYVTLTKSLLANYPNMTLEEAQNMAKKLLMMEE